jgi:hypothetical protein
VTDTPHILVRLLADALHGGVPPPPRSRHKPTPMSPFLPAQLSCAGAVGMFTEQRPVLFVCVGWGGQPVDVEPDPRATGQRGILFPTQNIHTVHLTWTARTRVL